MESVKITGMPNISKSKVVSFECYCPDRDTQTQRNRQLYTDHVTRTTWCEQRQMPLKLTVGCHRSLRSRSHSRRIRRLQWLLQLRADVDGYMLSCRIAGVAALTKTAGFFTGKSASVS